MFKQISNEKNIIIECNNLNVFKIHFSSTLNSNANIENIITNGEFYQLLNFLNQDIIESYQINNVDGMDDVSYVLNFGSSMKEFFQNNDAVRCKLHLLNKTNIQHPKKFQIVGNSLPSSDLDIKEIKISNLEINIEIINNTISVLLFYQDLDSQSNKLQKHIFAKLLSKIFFRLKKYLE